MRKLILIFIILSACSGKYQNKLNFNPSEAIRVAILPIAEVDQNNKFTDYSERVLIDGVPFLSEEKTQAPGIIVTKAIRQQLDQSSLDLIPGNLISVELEHHGLIKANRKYDLEKLYQAQPAEICQHLVNCDAIIRGRIKKWERSYYGVQSINSVEIELEMLGKDGKVLFTASGSDSDSRGLSKIPTGISSLVLEPIKGLDQEIIINLANQVIAKMLEPISNSNNKVYETAAPAIYGAAHDALTGKIDPKKGLAVMIYGAPGNNGSFSIGNQIQDIPMLERGKGRYLGYFYPLDNDQFQDQTIWVKLEDNFKRSVKQKISNPKVNLK